MVREESRQVFVARLQQNGEVATVNHVHPQRPRTCHQVAKQRVHLWRAAGQIQRLHALSLQHLQHKIDVGVIHHLGAVGARVHVAVLAGLVAFVAQIDLQRGQARAADGWKLGGLQQGQCGVHGDGQKNRVCAGQRDFGFSGPRKNSPCNHGIQRPQPLSRPRSFDSRQAACQLGCTEKRCTKPRSMWSFQCHTQAPCADHAPHDATAWRGPQASRYSERFRGR